MIEIYTTESCARCKLLKERMKAKGINFKENQDEDEIIKLGFLTAPIVKLEDGELLDFGKAVSWVNSF